MRGLKDWLFLLSLFFRLFNLALAQSGSVPSLSYGDLIAKQDDYVDKRVRVSGNWFIFFEVSALHGANEKIRTNAAWVQFVDEDVLCKGSKRKLKKLGKYVGET